MALTSPAVASATSTTSVLLAFAPAGEPELASIPGASVGIMSASQGAYSLPQLAIDISQGARIASSAYASAAPLQLRLRVAGSGGAIVGWSAALRRAEAAPQLLRPGLLVAQIATGAGYVGVTASASPAAPVAAGPSGVIATVSLGSAASLPARAQAALESRRLVVADLPEDGEAPSQLRALAAARAPGELLLIVQRSSEQPQGALLWTAAVGLAGGASRELSSQSTEQRGLLVSVDLAPTILSHLGARTISGAIRGKPIRVDGTLQAASLRSLMARLRVIGQRRLKALAWLLGAWGALAIAAAPWAMARAWALRVGALGVFWAPVAALATAALEPSTAVEYVTIALACLSLGALTDLLVPWPRAALAPALATLIALSGDALAHTQLLMRSLPGPDPILGARFYGIGNELKSALAVLVLAGVAGALYPSTRGLRARSMMAAAGVALAVIEGSARIGAGVGGVILVSGAFAVAVTMLAQGALRRRRALILLISPLLALVALALLDLLTAHGAGHFTGSVLHAGSAAELRDVIVRRYSAAWSELGNQAMPLATAVALACAVIGVRARTRLLEPVEGDAGWLAALSGGLAAGVLGSLVEDSGPVLLVVAVFVLGCVCAYLWGRPALTPRSPGTPRGSLSRARRLPAAPVR